MRLTIIVPAFNEAGRLPEGFQRFDAAIADGSIDPSRTELIIVDDGSTDETTAVASRLLAPFPNHQVVTLPANQGKGAAVRVGVANARGAAIVFMDADMAIDPRAVPLLLDRLDEYDIAIGSRAMAGSTAETAHVARSFMGHMFNRLVTTGTGLALLDTQCGFKGFRAPVARLLFQFVGIDRFAFDFELLLRAHRLGFAIAEVPVQWKHIAGSTVRPLRDSVDMLFDVVRSRAGRVSTPSVEAVSITTKAPDEYLQTRIIRALADTPQSTAVCLVAGPAGFTLLFPLLPVSEILASYEALKERLRPFSVVRQLIAFDQLESLRPLAGRLISV